MIIPPSSLTIQDLVILRHQRSPWFYLLIDNLAEQGCISMRMEGFEVAKPRMFKALIEAFDRRLEALSPYTHTPPTGDSVAL